MRDIYRMVEEMMISRKLSTNTLITELTNQIETMITIDSALNVKYMSYIHETAHRMQVGIIYPSDGVLMVDSSGLKYKNEIGNLVDIGNNIRIVVATEEHFYRFLTRNNILRQDNKVILERLALEYV